MSVGSFLLAVAVIALRYRLSHSLTFSVYHVTKPAVILGILALTIYAVVGLTNFYYDVLRLHAAEVRSDVLSQLVPILYSVAGLGASLFLLVLYASWKFRSQTFIEARVGLLKDLVIELESIFSRSSSPLSERREQAISLTLERLGTIMQMSSWDWLSRKLRTLHGQSAGIVSAWYLVPNHEQEQFVIQNVQIPPYLAVDARVREAFQTAKVEHHPKFLNEDMFAEVIKEAKNSGGKDWKRWFLRMPKRNECVSASGWVYNYSRTLFENHARNSLYFDDSWFVSMQKQNYTRQQLACVKAGCFIGCPVGRRGDAGEGVLFVVKNVPNGFQPEDVEMVIIAASFIKRLFWNSSHDFNNLSPDNQREG